MYADSRILIMPASVQCYIIKLHNNYDFVIAKPLALNCT